ncbi:unnamed protein product [Orchesella dallaii]|uniref:Uncharacterized protein n=1 Tax=Orchesella dallaii TaxID=48710 RepID=A0ABP1RPX5_9HEXA
MNSLTTTTINKQKTKNSEPVSEISILVKLILEMKDEFTGSLANMDTKLDVITTVQQSLQQLTTDVAISKEEIETLKTGLSQTRQVAENTAEKLRNIQKQNDRIELELRKINLVISGIDDFRSQTSNKLTNAVENLLRTLAGREIKIEAVYRIGKYRDKYIRPVKINFKNISERNTIYECRLNTVYPIYINEDLQPSIQKAHRNLRRKSKE